MRNGSWPLVLQSGVVDKQREALDTLVNEFILSQDVSDMSKITYRKALLRFLDWMTEGAVRRPTREDILSYKQLLKAKDYSPHTISLYMVAVRKFFDWTDGLRLYPNVARGTKGAKKTKGFRKYPLTIVQVKDLLSSIERSSAEGKRDYALVNLLIRTGLRTIEAVRADIGDISQEGGEAVLWVQGKGRDAKDEFALLTDATLRPILDCVQTRSAQSDTDPIFVSHSDRNRNTRLTTRSVSRIVKNRLRSIGLDSGRFTAHSVRHTAITLSLQGGATVQEARALGRHADINRTLIYSHNIDRIANAPERKIDSVLSSEG